MEFRLVETPSRTRKVFLGEQFVNHLYDGLPVTDRTIDSHD